MLQIRETYLNASDGNQFGDTGWYEPYTEDRGELFRAFHHPGSQESHIGEEIHERNTRYPRARPGRQFADRLPGLRHCDPHRGGDVSGPAPRRWW